MPTDFRWAFLVLEEHPYGREMLAQLLEAGFVPSLLIEERSEVAEAEREKFFVRIAGQPVPPTLTELLEGRDVERVVVSSHNGRACRDLLRALAPDVLVLGGTRILRSRIFEPAKDGAFNSHPGLLPELRGSASVAWAIQKDLPVGCTCHRIDAGIDTGPILGRRALEVRRGDTYEKLCRETMTLSGTLMREALEAYAAGSLSETPQAVGPEALRNMPGEMVAEVAAKLAEQRYAHYVD